MIRPLRSTSRCRTDSTEHYAGIDPAWALDWSYVHVILGQAPLGMLNVATQAGRRPVHHTLGNGEFDLFRKLAEPVVCASAILTPQNVAAETEQLIAEA